jgi:hypothetical protein
VFPQAIQICGSCPIIRRDWPEQPAPPTDGFDNADALNGPAKLAANPARNDGQKKAVSDLIDQMKMAAIAGQAK